MKNLVDCMEWEGQRISIRIPPFTIYNDNVHHNANHNNARRNKNATRMQNTSTKTTTRTLTNETTNNLQQNMQEYYYDIKFLPIQYSRCRCNSLQRDTDHVVE